MGVLIDTSIWVEHFRRANTRLVQLISLDLAMTHPMIVLELACGMPPAPRLKTLEDISALLPTMQATQEEVLEFIEREKLYGMGCGLVDLSLLASVLVTPQVQLWSMDKRLMELAERFKIAYWPTH